MKEFVLNRLHYVSLPYCIFDCWLMLSGVTFDTLQDKQMLDDFVEAIRGDISCIMIDRYINNGNGKANGNSNSYGNSNGNENDNAADNDNDNAADYMVHRRKQPIRLCNDAEATLYGLQVL